jgi:hypothetical protein
MGANFLIVVATFALQTPPPDTAPTTSPTHGIAFERLTDLLQYNRVQGLSVGLGYQLRISAAGATTLYGTVRYGLSDERVTGRLTILRSVAGGSLALTGYRDIADLDPFSPGRSFANTFNGLFAGHDNGDYALGRGASARFEMPLRPGVGLVLGGRVERMTSVSRVARSAVNDFLGGTGLFPPNPAVEEGTYGAASAQLRRVGRNAWSITADVLAGEGRSVGRLFGDARRVLGSGFRVTFRLKAGVGTEPAMPQSLFRVGGLHTVRGFEYGTQRGSLFWAGQMDISPFGGRVHPVIFVDAGQASSASDLLSGTALVGGGIGLSLLRGLVRFDLSRPISPSGADKLRFDLVIQGIR